MAYIAPAMTRAAAAPTTGGDEKLRLTLVGAVAAAVCGMAIYVASRRINGVAYNEDWPVLLGLIFLCAFSLGHRRRHRAVQRDVLPRKRRLEALLKELDGQ